MLPKFVLAAYMETHIATAVDHTYSTNDATTHSFSQLIVQDKVYAFCSSIARAYTKVAFSLHGASKSTTTTVYHK
jgi:hypothetical protein